MDIEEYKSKEFPPEYDSTGYLSGIDFFQAYGVFDYLQEKVILGGVIVDRYGTKFPVKARIVPIGLPDNSTTMGVLISESDSDMVAFGGKSVLVTPSPDDSFSVRVHDGRPYKKRKDMDVALVYFGWEGKDEIQNSLNIMHERVFQSFFNYETFPPRGSSHTFTVDENNFVIGNIPKGEKVNERYDWYRQENGVFVSEEGVCNGGMNFINAIQEKVTQMLTEQR